MAKIKSSFRRKGDIQKCRRVDMKFFYQGITEVKILKRTAKAESSDAQRAELGLQEHCTQSRIRNESCMLLQTELMKKYISAKYKLCHSLGGLPFIAKADYTSLSLLYQVMCHTFQL